MLRGQHLDAYERVRQVPRQRRMHDVVVRRAVAQRNQVGLAGVDVSDQMLDVAREKCGRNQLYVEFRVADVLALPFPDGGAGAGAGGGAAVAVMPASGLQRPCARAAPRRPARRSIPGTPR